MATPAADSPKRLSRATKDVAFGSMAGMAAKFFEHPFDLVKVRLQTQRMDRPAVYKGALDCASQTWNKEGLRGLYRGISMPIIGACLENATLFVVYNAVQQVIRAQSGTSLPTTSSTLEAAEQAPLSMPQLGIAAACAGSITSFVLTPVELIKCRMQVQLISAEAAAGGVGAIAAGAGAGAGASSKAAFANLPGPVALVQQTLRKEGLRGLWLGQTGTLLRETGGGVAWFLAFEGVSRWFCERRKAAGRPSTKKDLSSLELVAAGACSGVGYNVALFPADSVKSTMQTEAEMAAPLKPGEAPRPRTGFGQTFLRIYRTRGLAGLYAGCGVTCLRSAPSSALIFLLYTKLEGLADDFGL